MEKTAKFALKDLALFRLMTFSLFLGAALSIGNASAEPSPSSEPSKMVVNFRTTDEGKVYRGGRPQDSGLEALAKLGVKTVIDLQGGDLENSAFSVYVVPNAPGELPVNIAEEREKASSLGMAFYSVPLNSMKNLNNTTDRPRILKILEIMNDPARQPVFIHCEHGKDRTGLIAALYRVQVDHCEPKKAHDEMVSDGHSGFMDHLVTGKMDTSFYQLSRDLPKVDNSVSCPL